MQTYSCSSVALYKYQTPTLSLIVVTSLAGLGRFGFLGVFTWDCFDSRVEDGVWDSLTGFLIFDKLTKVAENF